MQGTVGLLVHVEGLIVIFVKIPVIRCVNIWIQQKRFFSLLPPLYDYGHSSLHVHNITIKANIKSKINH